MTDKYIYKEYPQYLYHEILAPGGKIFNTVKDTKGLKHKGWVFVQGRWKTTAGNMKLNIPSRINTISITCDKDSMTCKETIASVLTPQEEQLFEKPELFIAETIYQIVDWSNDAIIAKCEAPVGNFELRISPKDKLAERRYRETRAPGSKTSNPDNYLQWILE